MFQEWALNQIAIPIIRTALTQRRRLLQRQAREHKLDLGTYIKEIDFALYPLHPRFPGRHPQSIASLRGLYGSGMKSYWDAFPQFIRNPDFSFNGRKGNSTVSEMLDFTYGLLHEECKRAIILSGLDPQAGIISTHRKEPLVLDLAIEFRLYAELIVLRTINRDRVKGFAGEIPFQLRQRIALEMEKKLDEEITHPATRQRCSYKEAMRLQAALLRECLQDDLQCEAVYLPLLLK